MSGAAEELVAGGAGESRTRDKPWLSRLTEKTDLHNTFSGSFPDLTDIFIGQDQKQSPHLAGSFAAISLRRI
jgi:hypothetical protein